MSEEEKENSGKKAKFITIYVPKSFKKWFWTWLFLMMCVALYGYLRYAHDGWTPDHLLQLIPFISGG